jgi:hypothetical protein
MHSGRHRRWLTSLRPVRQLTVRRVGAAMQCFARESTQLKENRMQQIHPPNATRQPRHQAASLSKPIIKSVAAALLLGPLLALAQRLPAGDCLTATDPSSCQAFGASTGYQQVVGDGVLLTEVRELPAFTALSSSAAITIDALASRPAQRVQISGDENIVPLITTDVVDGRLKIGVRPGYSIQTRLALKADLEVASLGSIDISGSSSVKAAGLAGQTFRYSISGWSAATLSGSVGEVIYSLPGSGSIDGEALAASKGSARISGSGRIVVNASDSLNAVISGSGSIYYLGTPAVTKRITGIGTVAPK